MTAVLTDFSPAALRRAIEASAVEGCRAWGRWPRLDVIDHADSVSIVSDVRYFVFNGVLSARLAGAEAVDAVVGRFRERRLPMIWWTGPGTAPADMEDLLLARGFIHAGEPAGMAVDLHTLDAELAPPPGVAVETVGDGAALAAWSAVSASVFGFPDFAARAWHEVHSAAGLDGETHWRHFLARIDGEPVATSSLFTGAGVASIASVATLPHAQRRGIGTAMSLAPLIEARRRGFRIGTLCASAEGEPVYRRMGFREYCRMGMFLRKWD